MLGMGKLRMLKGDDVLVPRRSKDQEAGDTGGAVATGGGGKNGNLEERNGLVFSLLPHDEEVRQTVQRMEPAFNVLYVETPRVEILQSPQWREFADTWREAMAMVASACRLGLPRTSVSGKSPYLDPALWSKPEGSVLLNDRMARAAAARSGAAFGTGEERREEEARRRSRRAPLAALERAAAVEEVKLPREHFYLHEPSPMVVVGLNLAAYWLITRGNLKKAG
jgi:hypothetical protein